MLYSAFEQFEMMSLMPLNMEGVDMSMTNSTMFMGLAWMMYVVMYSANMGGKSGSMMPGSWQSALEMVYVGMYDMVKDMMGKSGAKYFPFMLTIFLFMALLNMMGMVPYTFAPTSHVAVTFGLSLSMFMGVTLLGMVNYKWDYFSMFMPSGTPLVLAPFMVVMELASHAAKAMSLGARLAANITAGHILFAMLSGMTWSVLTAGGLMSMLSVFPILMVVAMTVLEMAVALMHAYVFSLLTAIYMGEAEHLH